MPDLLIILILSILQLCIFDSFGCSDIARSQKKNTHMVTIAIANPSCFNYIIPNSHACCMQVVTFLPSDPPPPPRMFWSTVQIVGWEPEGH